MNDLVVPRHCQFRSTQTQTRESRWHVITCVVFAKTDWAGSDETDILNICLNKLTFFFRCTQVSRTTTTSHLSYQFLPGFFSQALKKLLFVTMVHKFTFLSTLATLSSALASSGHPESQGRRLALVRIYFGLSSSELRRSLDLVPPIRDCYILPY